MVTLGWVSCPRAVLTRFWPPWCPLPNSCVPLPPSPQVLTSKGDAWAKYMAEVKKYKAHQCGDDDKTRPLVK